MGNIDGDEHVDAVVLGKDGTLSLMAGGPDGTLTVTHQETSAAESIQLADITGDQTLELLVTGVDVIDVRLLDDGTDSFRQSVVSNVDDLVIGLRAGGPITAGVMRFTP